VGCELSSADAVSDPFAALQFPLPADGLRDGRRGSPTVFVLFTPMIATFDTGLPVIVLTARPARNTCLTMREGQFGRGRPALGGAVRVRVGVSIGISVLIALYVCSTLFSM
jgi:hypothetical protein